MPHKITVVTVTHNSSSELHQFWKDAPTSEFEWIVVDNASEDDSSLAAITLGAKSLVQLNYNEGFSRANNRGADLASHDIIGFVNPDVSITSLGLSQIETALKDKECLASLQLRNLDGSLQPNGRGTPSLNYKLLGRLSPRVAEKVGYYLYKRDYAPLPVDWLMGASVFMRRSTFLRLGGWDEGYFLYYEDSDLGIRARRESVPSYIVGSETWVHDWGRATKNLNVAAWRQEISSAIRFYKKYPEFLWGHVLVDNK